MVEQFFEFIINHWLLSTVWIVLLALLIKTETAKGGTALSTAQVTQMINKQNAKVVDIRNKDEFRTGHLPDAINIPAKDMQKRMSELNAHKSLPIIIVCKSGTSAGSIGAMLSKEGFTSMHKLRGGMLEWTGNNLPVVK